jgi:transcriptional regulator with GAF, ATPase, and Fis domain
VIAATHRDLPQMVQDREFREDLWYRIAVFPIILPPLRERPEDLPALALHFIQRAANRAGIHAPRMSEGDIARLQAYDWPGNVRELGAVIERAVILGQGDKLALDAALGPASGMPPRATLAPASVVQSPAEASSGGAVETLETVIDNHIRNVVAQCGGRLDGPFGAARLLGLNVNTLRSKMRKLGIRRNELSTR